MINDNDNFAWLREILPYITTVALSAWGGTVNYLSKLRKTGQRFSFWRFYSEICVASFAGIITFFLCNNASISETMTAALVAISGHMGTRAICGLENIYKRIFNFESNCSSCRLKDKNDED